MFEYMQYNIAPWGWEISLYFFLIGMSAMCFVLASAPNVFGAPAIALQSHQKSVLLLSFALLMISGPLLIIDLGQPARFLYPIIYFHWTSPLSWGAAFLPLFGLCILGFWYSLKQGRSEWLKPIGVVGSLLALSMPLYTGLDLMVNGTRELWATTTLPIFFVVLSISSGAGITAVALKLMGGLNEGATHLLRNVLYFSLAMTLALFLGIITSLGYGSGEMQQALGLITDQYGGIFWGVSLVLCTLIPLGLVIIPDTARNPTHVLIAGVLATVGAYTFRKVIVEAGQLPQLFF